MNPPAGSPAQHARYYPYIDGLRALAVLAVLVYHLHGPWLPGGFAGVDVFFVISGFVVSASVARASHQGFGLFLGEFYARRIRRIVPALLVCLLVTALFSALFIPSAWLSAANERTGLYAFFGLSNWVLAEGGRDYFAPVTEYNPFAHTWSLGVEEQFYLLFPLLFFAWLVNDKGRRLSSALFSLLLLASFAAALWLHRQDGVAVYFLTQGRLWELAAGVLLYQWIGQRGPTAAAQNTLVNPASLLFMLLLLGGLLLSPAEHFPAPGALPVVIATLGLIYCLHRNPNPVAMHRLLGARPLLFVGRISYSLYLWHWPVFVLFRWTCGLESLPERLMALALSFLLATASWRYIETPLRRSSPNARFPRAAPVLLGLIAIGVGWAGTTLIIDQRANISLSQVTRNPAIWYPEGSRVDPASANCNAEPEYHDAEGGLLLIYRPRNCPPAREGAPVIYVIGDSHALAYEALFKQYAMARGVPIHAYNNGGCPYVSLQPWRDIDNPACSRYSDAALRHLRQRIKPGDVLFLPSLRMPRLSDQWGAFSQEKIEEQVFSARAVAGRERATAVAIQALREFSDAGVRVILEAPKPVFRAPPLRCADWYSRNNPVCEPGFNLPRVKLERYRAPTLAAFATITQALPGVSIWDPFPLLCPDVACSAWRNGLPLFLDGDHLSGYGNQLLYEPFSQMLAPRASALPEPGR